MKIIYRITNKKPPRAYRKVAKRAFQSALDGGPRRGTFFKHHAYPNAWVYAWVPVL